jgi:hypothetical protein
MEDPMSDDRTAESDVLDIIVAAASDQLKWSADRVRDAIIRGILSDQDMREGILESVRTADYIEGWKAIGVASHRGESTVRGWMYRHREFKLIIEKLRGKPRVRRDLLQRWLEGRGRKHVM